MPHSRGGTADSIADNVSESAHQYERVGKERPSKSHHRFSADWNWPTRADLQPKESPRGGFKPRTVRMRAVWRLCVQENYRNWSFRCLDRLHADRLDTTRKGKPLWRYIPRDGAKECIWNLTKRSESLNKAASNINPWRFL